MLNRQGRSWFQSFWMTPSRLSDRDWRARHRVVVAVLLLHFPILLAIGLYGGRDEIISKITFTQVDPGAALFVAAAPALMGLLALLPSLPRRVAATVASIGLVLASAVLTHFTGGYIEAHFHYFVMLGLAAVYIDWLPVTAAIAFVITHHSIMGAVDPASVYNHPLAIAHPWRWAAIHTAFLLGLGAALIANIGLAHRTMDAAADHAWVARRQATDRHAAEAVAQARGDFLRHMSHEVRTPLNAILGMANLMSRDKEAFNQDRLNVINASGRHLLELIQQLLDMNHIDTGRIEMVERPIDVREFLSQIIRIVNDSGDEPLDVQLIMDGSIQASFDPTRVRQVLLNLLGNAAKYGGNTPIRLEVTLEDGMLAFRVHDEGPGIDPEDLERIFEPYQQVGPEATRSGAGLGLAISRRLATAMNGTLTGAAEAGIGTTFTFKLPYVPVNMEPPTAEQRWTDWGKGKSVLLAEDDPFSAMVATEFLEGGGVNVTLVGNGVEAVKKAPEGYDAILLDARMPLLDGLGASAQIRELGIQAPIIGVSARASEDDHQEARKAGMNAYLTKPLDFDGLVATLKSQWGEPIQ